MKKIFISYSHKDTAFKDMLVEQLRVLELEGFCDIWEDSRIQLGTDWLPEIKKAIDEANVAVLMVSAGFLTSNFIRVEEVPRMMERRKKEGLIVLPLFVKPCNWITVPWLSCIQGFPSGDKTLMEYAKPKRLKYLKEFAKSIYYIMYPDKKEKPDIPSYDPLTHSVVETKLFTSLPPMQIKLIGREKELAALEQTLNTSKRVVLVNGMGGVGKTEVCKTFFLDHYNRYCYAAWVDWISSVKESLGYALGGDKSEFIQAGEKDTTDERFKKILTRLRQIREPMLLVLDNIENPEDKDLVALASLSQEIKILASSRCYIEGYEELSLEFLSPAQCKELFYRFYKEKPDDESVEKVVALCGYHTLTVELLAKTAHHEAMSVKTLYNTLNSKGFNLNEVTGGKIGTFWHNETKKKTFFDHLVKVFEISGITQEELDVMSNMSVLPAVYIKMEWIREWLRLKGMDELNALVEKGWLKRNDESRIYLHPVMQEVVRHRTKPNAKKCRALIGSLANKLFMEPGANSIHKKEFLIYGESVDRGMNTGENDENLATLANNLSMIYKALGQLDQALEFQLKALKIWEVLLDKNLPDLAASYNNASTTYQALGQLDLALKFQLKAIEIREELMDKNHPDLATSYNNISLIYKDMGQLEKALEFQLKALKIDELTLDKNDPNLATSYNNISTNYQALGQFDQALEFQLNALKIRETVLDMNHPDRAQSYHNLSLLYQDMYDYTNALKYAEKAVAILQLKFPCGHPNLDLAKKNLENIRLFVFLVSEKKKVEGG